MINFTVGPVQEYEKILRVGSQPTPYFRNEMFSRIMLENENMMKHLLYLQDDGRVVFLTASGTGAMEAAIINSFSTKDKVLIVDGGTFGHRFVELCQIYNIEHDVLVLPQEEDLTLDKLFPFENRGYTGFIINMHETSIGKLYDMNIVADFCNRNNLFLVVDAISSFLADPIYMSKWSIDVLITGSQKALALPPGISIVALSERGVSRVESNTVNSLYFDLKRALKDGERGQTPFTPAVSILLQMNERLKDIFETGIAKENERIANLASYFRSKIGELPLKILTHKLSNAVTPLCPINGMSAYEIFEILEHDYGIWICPSGGNLKDKLFRVGHLGDLKKEDYDILIYALQKICSSM